MAMSCCQSTFTFLPSTVFSSNSSSNLNLISVVLKVLSAFIEMTPSAPTWITRLGFVMLPICRVANPIPSERKQNKLSSKVLSLKFLYIIKVTQTQSHWPTAFMYSSKFSLEAKVQVPANCSTMVVKDAQSQRESCSGLQVSLHSRSPLEMKLYEVWTTGAHDSLLPIISRCCRCHGNQRLRRRVFKPDWDYLFDRVYWLQNY